MDQVVAHSLATFARISGRARQGWRKRSSSEETVSGQLEKPVAPGGLG
jgi:hypothetical protein